MDSVVKELREQCPLEFLGQNRPCYQHKNNKKVEAVPEPKTHCSSRREAEMHPCLLKVKATMRRDCRKTLCLIQARRLPGRASCCDWQNGSPLGCRLQQIRFWTIGFMLFDKGHAKDVPCLVSVFRRRTIFKLSTAKVHRSYRKISFWRKATP